PLGRFWRLEAARSPDAILPQPPWKNNESRAFHPGRGRFDRDRPAVVHGAGFARVRQQTMSRFVVEFGKDGTPPAEEGRLDAPAFHRNHEAIWAALAPFLAAKTGDVLELGSGTGQHAVTYGARTPGLTWHPS